MRMKSVFSVLRKGDSVSAHNTESYGRKDELNEVKSIIENQGMARFNVLGDEPPPFSGR